MSLATLDEDNSSNRLLRPGWLGDDEQVYLMSNVKFTKVQPLQPGYFYCTDQRLVWTKYHAVEVRPEADIPYSIITDTQIWEGETKHRRLTLTLRPDGRRDHHVQIFEFVSETAPSEVIAFRNLIARFTSMIDRSLSSQCTTGSIDLSNSTTSSSPSVVPSSTSSLTSSSGSTSTPTPSTSTPSSSSNTEDT